MRLARRLGQSGAISPTTTPCYTDTSHLKEWIKKRCLRTRRIIAAATLTTLAALLAFPGFSSGSPISSDKATNDKGPEIYTLPDEAALENSSFKPEWFSVVPLKPRDGKENLEDFEWLRSVAKTHEAVLIGEQHWFSISDDLVKEIFFALNRFDNYPTLFIEDEYSYSPYLDHFVTTLNNKEAETFFQTELDDLLCTEELRILLEDIRQWNKRHPTRMLHVACNDIEHDWKITLEKIVFPYMKSIDARFSLDLSTATLETLPSITTRIRAAIASGDGRQRPPQPFLTQDFIETILDNLDSTAQTYQLKEEKAWFDSRQKAILRNLTDKKFNGRYLDGHKIVLYGGGEHMPSHACDDSSRALTQGNFLSCQNPSTKGKTYSISLWGFYYRFKNMAGANPEEYKSNAPMYWDEVIAFGKAQEAGRASPDGYYVFGSNPLFGGFFDPIIALSYRNSHVPLRLISVKWDLVDAAARRMDAYEKIAKRAIYSDIDTIIFFDRSDIVQTRKKAQRHPDRKQTRWSRWILKSKF